MTKNEERKKKLKWGDGWEFALRIRVGHGGLNLNIHSSNKLKDFVSAAAATQSPTTLQTHNSKRSKGLNYQIQSKDDM
jgi:hypothetical protein